MGKLTGQVALVTGAGRGIGREYALAFAREGAHVVVNDLGGALPGGGSSQEPAADVVAEIEALGGKALASYADVADHQAAARTVRECVDAFGRLDVLITNAGISRRTPLVTLPEQGFDAIVGTHLKGTYNFVHHAAPLMIEQGSGSILTVTSGAAWIPNPRSVAYAAAKGGIFSLTLGLAAELAPHGVRVNALSPGLTATRLGDAALADIRREFDLSEEALRDWVGEIQPADALAPLALFLACPEAREITGCIFEVVGDRIQRVSPASRGQAFARPGGWGLRDLLASFPRRFDD